MSSVAAICDSKDAAQIKKARRNAKYKVTRFYNYLSGLLQVSSEGTHDHTNLTGEEVKKATEELQVAYKDAQKLHDAYQLNRAEGNTEQEEDRLADEEEKWMDGVSNKY